MKVNILDFLDFKKVDTLLEGFNKSTGFVTAILDLDGKVLSQSGWRQICTEFHRINPETAKKCTISDTVLAGKIDEGEQYHFYKCLNGLVDVAVPIVIKGAHVANLFSGQFFFEKPDWMFFKKQAEEYGFDEEKYLEALAKVPVVSEERVKTAMDFLLNMTQLISETTFQKLERQTLNDAILKSEERFKTFMEETPVYAYIKDGSLNHVFSNKKVLELTQLTRIGQTADSARTLFEPEIADYLESADKEILSGRSARVELEYEVNIGGQDKWLNDIKFALKLTDDTKGVGGLAFDITERKKVEEQLRESEKRFRIAQELSPDGFAILRPVRDALGRVADFTWVYENAMIARLNGTEPKSVVGRRLLELFPEHRGSKFMSAYQQVAESGEHCIFVADYMGEGSSEPTWLRIVVVPAGEDIAILAQDVTERQRAEEALRQKAEELRASNVELQLFNRAMVGRELRMIELKEEIDMLCRRLGEPPRYGTKQHEADRAPDAGPVPKA